MTRPARVRLLAPLYGPLIAYLWTPWQRRAQLTTAIRLCRDELRATIEGSLQALSIAVDLRDRETGNHSQRVADGTVTFARAFGIAEGAIEGIYRGALLHDIGKLGVPDSVLLKQGGLDEAEWELMRMHTTYGMRILRRVAWLRNSTDIPQYHHERWDGSGYPFGLKADDIPIAARLFAIVDSFDAITSDRPYRGARSVAVALAEIKAGRGTLYDPHAVDVYLAMPA